MLGWLFGNKEVKRIEVETKKGFDSVKKDISAVSGWIKHLDSEKTMLKKDVDEIRVVLSTVKDDLDGLKNVFSFMQENGQKKVFKQPFKQVFKQVKQVFNKQTGVEGVQTGVGTEKQTLKIDQFPLSERAILWVLLNNDMKLSYDDLASLLGKERSTIRGQINRIKQKSEGLIEEFVEKTGKKRVYIPERMKEILLKKPKVRVKKGEKPENEEKE